jgi:hypothetical protein
VNRAELGPEHLRRGRPSKPPLGEHYSHGKRGPEQACCAPHQQAAVKAVKWEQGVGEPAEGARSGYQATKRPGRKRDEVLARAIRGAGRGKRPPLR